MNHVKGKQRSPRLLLLLLLLLLMLMLLLLLHFLSSFATCCSINVSTAAYKQLAT